MPFSVALQTEADCEWSQTWSQFFKQPLQKQRASSLQIVAITSAVQQSSITVFPGMTVTLTLDQREHQLTANTLTHALFLARFGLKGQVTAISSYGIIQTLMRH